MNAIAEWINGGKYRHWYVIGAGISAVLAMSGVSIHDLDIAYETAKDFLKGLSEDYVEDEPVTKEMVKKMWIGD